MKKCKNKIKKNNSYFLGGLVGKDGELNKWGNLTNAVSDIGTSLVPSSGNARTDAVNNGIAGGLETVGSAFGPIGGVVGKAAGFLTKGIGAMVGTSDKVNTETGEYTKGKGIKGRRSRDRVLAQWRRVNQGIDDTNQGAAMAEDYANEYAGNDYSLAAYGGVLPTTMAYVDDGELLRTPDGKISEIPEEGKPTDSNLINVPVGTQVLSDKLKVPGTNKTFAQMGKKYMKTGNKKGSDIYAQNSQKLNDWNNQKKYNDLLALQESLKNKKGIKSKVSKYDEGTDYVDYVEGTEYPQYEYRNIPVPTIYNAFIPNFPRPANELPEIVVTGSKPNKANNPYAVNWNEVMDNDFVPQNVVTQPSNDQVGLENNKLQYYAKRQYKLFNDGPAIRSGLMRAGWSHGGNDKLVDIPELPNLNDYEFNGTTDSKATSSKKSSDKNNSAVPSTAAKPTKVASQQKTSSPAAKTKVPASATAATETSHKPQTTRPFTKSRPLSYDLQLDRLRNEVFNEKIDPSKGLWDYSNNPVRNKIQRDMDINNAVQSLASYGAALMGPLANIRNGNPEQARMFTYSPHFVPVEYDITDQINSANESAAISRYNADRIGGAGRGASLAQSIQSQIARDNAIYNLYNQKNNIENERMARNAGIYNDWARYNSEMQHRAYEEDTQNRAAARNIRNTGISQLGTAMQSISRDKRLNAKDQAMLEYMREFFNYGSTKDTVDRLYKQMR